MFNLAIILIIEEESKTEKNRNFKEAIRFLFELASFGFFPAQFLIDYLLLRQYGCLNLEIIQSEINGTIEQRNKLFQFYVNHMNIFSSQKTIQYYYNYYLHTDLVYILDDIKTLENIQMYHKKACKKFQQANVDEHFYEGFNI